jgi:DNA primase
VVEFQIDTVLSQKLDPRKLPQALRDNVFPFIAPLTGAMEKAHYIKLIKEKTGISEDSIREDLKQAESLIKNEVVQVKKEEQIKNNSSRLDTITRKLFGLFYYLEKNPDLSINVDSNIATIKQISGDKYDNLIKNIEPFKNELLLEAEITFGTNKENIKDLKKILHESLNELMINFEDDIVREEFAEVMKSGIPSDQEKLNRLIKRRQEIENLLKKRI